MKGPGLAVGLVLVVGKVWNTHSEIKGMFTNQGLCLENEESYCVLYALSPVLFERNNFFQLTG